MDMEVTNDSPSPAPSVSTPHSASASRRPPRKSTLTQQQKNQKRQRATQDQLVTLELEFNKNPTPTAIVRERIAQEINMTERSVQIWFQNRRAKIKNIAKKSIESGEDCDGIPESMRKYLAMQAMSEGKGIGRELLVRNGMASFGSSGLMLNNDSNTQKVVIHHFSCRSLTIGTWRRVGQSAMDLVIFYSPDKNTVTYYINNDSSGYKIEYPFSFIKNITLENPDSASNAEGASQRPGGLVVELTRPPLFMMDYAGGGGFTECGDFTEEQQASQTLIHHLGGHPKVLSGQLAKLISLEGFQNRHNPFETPAALAVSAPVSPVGHRPQSQPNHLAHPHMGVFQEPQLPVGLHPGRPMGHKRQRSRSVPVAMDFAMLRQPMQPFLVPQPFQRGPTPAQGQFTSPQHNPDIHHPMPQYHSGTGPMGPNLSIDTSAGYGMDYRQYPMSATTTAPSPSDYGTPAFYTSAQAPDNMNAHANPQFNQQFTGHVDYMSPMPHVDVKPSMSSVSPMPMSHDPVIANQSPPLTGMGHHGGPESAADMYQIGHEGVILDDGLGMYGKASPMTLPFRNPLEPHMEHQHAQEQGRDHMLGMNGMVDFETIDPSSLNNPGMS